MSEYNDAIQRAQRLTVAREQLLLTGSCANSLISLQVDDLQIYLRWLVTHFYSTKAYTHFMKLLEWFPYLINKSLQQEPTSQDSSSAMADKRVSSTVESETTRAKSSLSNLSSNRILDNVYLSSPNALVPTEDLLNGISYCKLFYLIFHPNLNIQIEISIFFLNSVK